MPVQREAKYLSGADIGKTITYEVPANQLEPDGEKVQLGGVLEDVKHRGESYEETILCDTEPRFVVLLASITLTVSGHAVDMRPSRMVTLHGRDG